MSQLAARRSTSRRSFRPVIGLVLVVFAVAAIWLLGPRSTLSSLGPRSTVSSAGHRPTVGEAGPAPATSIHAKKPSRTSVETDGAVTKADGLLPDGVTAFDDRYPGVTKLDPRLLKALQKAASDAADDSIEFYVNSGWRSPDYQDHLLREAVATYGSKSEAARWVATADDSPHVSGDAVDLGGSRATAWLSEHGAAYGLCQIYRNEPWHFELRPKAADRGCPRMYADPTRDPRMRR